MRVLLTGAGGFLGGFIARGLRSEGHEVVAGLHAGPTEAAETDEAVVLDLENAASVSRGVADAAADIVVHSAAIGDPRRCEADPELARRVNVGGTEAVAAACRRVGARLVFLSTEQVFGGDRAPYSEHDEPAPLHEYGRTKAAGERIAAELGDQATTLRLSLVYGPSGNPGRSASEQVVAALRRGDRPRLFVDEFRTPVHVGDVASAIVEVVGMREPPRVLHVAGPERMSRYDFGVAVTRAHGLDAELIDAGRQADVVSTPARPKDLSLRTDLARRILKRPARDLRAGLADR